MSTKDDDVSVVERTIDSWNKHGRGFGVELCPQKAVVKSIDRIVAEIYYNGHVELYSDINVALAYLEEDDYKAGCTGMLCLSDDIDLLICILRCDCNGSEPYLQFALTSLDKERGTFRFSGKGGFHESMDFDAVKNFDKMLISAVAKRRCEDGELD